ncbi:MAG: hypothetical protein NVS9B4_00800 [Candidatus Acidiferrum sp.]
MPASVSTPKTCTVTVAPHLTAAQLTAIMAIAPENMTVAQHRIIDDAINRVSGGGNPAAVIGTLLA